MGVQWGMEELKFLASASMQIIHVEEFMLLITSTMLMHRPSPRFNPLCHLQLWH